MIATRRTALFAALVFLAACGGGGGGGSSSSTPGTTFTVSGAVSGAVTSGVTMTLLASGSPVATTSTVGGGAYSFTAVANGDYTVRPTRAGFSFAPATIAVHVAGANVTGQNFVASAIASPHAISGTVSGAVQQDVTMTLSGDADMVVTTGSGGAYAFTGLADGSYTITPTRSGFSFAPTSIDVAVAGADVTGRNFTASSVVAAPPAPAAIQVRPGNGGATVTWTPAPNATGYKIYYASSRPLTTASPYVQTTGTSIFVSGLPNNARRWFAVSATGPGGESALTAPRCGVPTTSSTQYEFAVTDLDVYDALCDDRLDQSRWYQNGAWSAGVSGGAAELSVDAEDMEPRTLRNHFFNSAVSVASPSRVTTLSALIAVPQATASRTGGALIRSSIRLTYSPPARRLQYPAASGDFLIVEVGLEDRGDGLTAFRQVYHCDDGACVTLGTTGVAFDVDPAGFSPIPGTVAKGAPASYDQPYRFTVRLDEATGVFHWSIEGGTEFATPASGTADPAVYLAATSSWTGPPRVLLTKAGSDADAGFMAAQLAVRTFDTSLAGGGSGKITARFDDVQVGFDDGAATPWDDFGGTGGNSGPSELSLSKWTQSGAGAPRVLPSGTGSVVLHHAATSRGIAATFGPALVLSNPEGIDVLQADIAMPSFVATSAAVRAIVRVEGRFHNNGTGTRPGDPTGDIFGTLFVNRSTASSSATYSIFRCENAACSSVTVLAAGSLGATPVFAGQLARVAYDRDADAFEFGLGATRLRVPAPAGAGYAAPARAPLKRIWTQLDLPAAAGTSASMDVRVNNVLVAALDAAPGQACSALDPSVAPLVALQNVAANPPAPAGGTIADGTYHVTATNVYTGPGGLSGAYGFSWRMLWQFSGSDGAAVLSHPGGAEKHVGSFGTSGANLLFLESCPIGGSKAFQYTVVSPTELRVYEQNWGNSGETAEYVLTRQ